MVEFNPDGSLKLPSHITNKLEEDKSKMKNQRCVKIKKEVVSYKPPKKCVLQLRLSEAFKDKAFVQNIFKSVNEKSVSPMSIKQLSDYDFEITIGSDFKRCSDCSALIRAYKEFLYNNVIEDKGTCTYEGIKQFNYEDYFD